MDKERFLEFDIDLACFATANQIDAVGWHVDRSARPEGFPAGPTVHLCDYEAQTIVLVQLVIGAIEKLASWATEQRLTFRDACDALGGLMDEVGRGERGLTETTRCLLSNTAALYLSGTRTYALAHGLNVDQFLVIRYYDVSLRERILRPGAVGRPGPLSPAQVSEAVLDHLAFDRRRHPERFRRHEPLRFRPKASR